MFAHKASIESSGQAGWQKAKGGVSLEDIQVSGARYFLVDHG